MTYSQKFLASQATFAFHGLGSGLAEQADQTSPRCTAPPWQMTHEPLHYTKRDAMCNL